MNQNFDWLVREAVYEPRTIIEPAHAHMTLRWRMALICLALFLIGCGLAGLGAWQPQL